jgi:uncharacterized OB-fold protein
VSAQYPLPAPDPHIDADSAAFWAATLAGRLLLGHCPACAETFWYPRPLCPQCGAWGADTVEASGHGTVETFSRIFRGVGEYAAAAPYYLAYVRLDEGPVLLTNLVDAEPEDVRIGAPVRVVFFPTESGRAALPRFMLTDGTT